jgi:hypothetical protein
VWQPYQQVLQGGLGKYAEGVLAGPSLAATWRTDPTPDEPNDTVVDLHLTVLDGWWYSSEYYTGWLVYLQQDGDEARQVSGQNLWSQTSRYEHNGWSSDEPAPPRWQIAGSGVQDSMRVAMLATDYVLVDAYPGTWHAAIGYRCFDATSAMSPVMPPEGLTYAWHIIGAPMVHEGDGFPDDPCAPTGGLEPILYEVPATWLFPPFTLLGNLSRYNRVGKNYDTYDAFTCAAPGVGYWLWVSENERGRTTYPGIARSDTNGSVPEWTDPDTPPDSNPMIWSVAHAAALDYDWHMIGTPTLDSIPLESVRIRNDDTGQLKWFKQAVQAHWVEPFLYYYDPVNMGYRLCGLESIADDNALRPWLGYWISLNRNMNLTVFIPLHRDLFK